jgi:outer membrane receptor protein involved in Fe transport
MLMTRILILFFIICIAQSAIDSSALAQSKSSVKDTMRIAVADSIRRSKNLETVTVTAERPLSATSDKSFRDSDFVLRPLNSAQDLLRLVPGLVLAQHAGGGKAEQIFLRGFDADHGTDVNISVDDVPVNMLSHGHGQGYADLHFIIPETIQEVDVVKGPYDTRYGDLATAGVVAFQTKDSLDHNLLKMEGGSFEEYRALALIKGPESQTIQSYFGTDLFYTRGPFDVPQDFHRLNLFAKTTASLGDDAKLSASLFSFSSSWNANGQIPERAVAEGLIDRFGSLDSTEGGATSRTTADITYTSGGDSPLTLTASYTDYHFRLFSDFTFFLVDTTQGDEIEQTDARTMVAFRGERTLPWILGDAIMNTKIGVSTRNDDIVVGLYHDSARVRLGTVVDAAIQESETGPYIEQEIGLGWIQFIFGLRADYATVNVQNLLNPGAQPNGINQQILLSPKANASIPVANDATVFLNFGDGFHSNDARAIVQSPGIPTLPRAIGGEIGLRYGEPSEFFSCSSSLWYLYLQSELVWDGDEGTLIAQGSTRREGVDLEAHIRPTDWLTVGGDATISQGRFIDSTVGNNYIPLAPNFTLTANALARWNAFSAALRLRHVDDRPANTNNTLTAQGYSVFDLSLSYNLTAWEFYANIENLFNVAWNEAQFAITSRIYDHGVLEPAITDIDFTAGTPFSIRMGIAYRF